MPDENEFLAQNEIDDILARGGHLPKPDERSDEQIPAVVRSNQAHRKNSLLPCPFCNGEANYATVQYGEKTVKEQGWEQDLFHYVSCIECGANTCGLVGQITKRQAADKWNRRA